VRSEAIDDLARALCKGQLEDAQPWDLGAAVRKLGDSLVGGASSLGAPEVRAACKVLNKQRHFDHARALGEAWRASCDFDPTVEKHLAQALINLSALDAAEGILDEALARSRFPGASAQLKGEVAEYEGLRGRILKQRYVVTDDKDTLVRATDQYLSQYQNRGDHPYWHGINAAALLAREEREGVAAGPARMRSADLAAKISADVLHLYQQNPSDPWLASTLSEVNLALGDCERAELWLYRFLHHPNVQPFDIDSYDRQLREIWGGNPLAGDSCADRLSTLIARHLMRSQSRWSVSQAQAMAIAKQTKANPDYLERNFSGSSSFTVEMVRRVLAACGSIGCVSNRRGERLGTGFVMAGAIAEALGGGAVFVTNAHVISRDVPNALAPENAVVSFELDPGGSGHPVFYEVKEILFTSPPGDLGVCVRAKDSLDVSIVRLNSFPSGADGLDIARNLPLVDSRTKAYIVGHPRGSGLHISPAMNGSFTTVRQPIPAAQEARSLMRNGK
jgi:hypothetical protein